MDVEWSLFGVVICHSLNMIQDFELIIMNYD